MNNGESEKSLLAIVVPAYREQFLKESLESIAKQTNQNFKCYIFDDCSKENIKNISSNYANFEYYRFDENLGGKNLIAHWNRCLERVNEKWIWLFSDDDVMAENCVEEFYKKQKEYHDKTYLFRFKHNTINESGIEIFPANPIKNENSFEFLKSIILNGIPSRLQEHIFDWEKLKKLGGFVEFPLAWGSDVATWCLLGKEKKIIAINSAIVNFRMSGNNISSQSSNMKEKFLANRLFYLWCVKNVNVTLRMKWKFIMSFAKNHYLPFKAHLQYPFFKSSIFAISLIIHYYLKLKYIIGRKCVTC